MLHRLLAEAGQDVFGGGGATGALALTAESARAAIRAVEPLPSPARFEPAPAPASDGSGPSPRSHAPPLKLAGFRFTTATGRVEVTGASAEFLPGASTRAAVRVRGSVVDGDGGSRLSVVTIGEALDDLQRRAGGGLSAMQGAALREHLRARPHQDPAAARGGRAPYVPEPRVLPYGESGDVVVRLADVGERLLTADGGLGPVPLPPAVATASLPEPPVFPTSALLPLVVTDGLLPLAFAVVLVVLGVRMLTGAGNGAAAHRAYARAKLALVAAGAVVTAMAIGSATVRLPDELGLILVVGILLQCVYPVALLLALRGDAVRRYYRRVGAGDDALTPAQRVGIAAALAPLDVTRWPAAAGVVVAVLAAGFALLHALVPVAGAMSGDRPALVDVGTHLLGAAAALGLAFVIVRRLLSRPTGGG